MANNYFQVEELKCPCCDRNNFSLDLLGVLNSIRSAVGRPVFLNSACRCEKYDLDVALKNLRHKFVCRKMLNGTLYGRAMRNECLKKRTSSHIKGLAADIRVNGSIEMDEILREVYQFVVPVIQRVGIYFRRGCVHIDIDKNKQQGVCWGD